MKRMFFIRLFTVSLFVLLLSDQLSADDRRVSLAPASDKRIALVIGNSDYKVSPLQNPGKDSDIMAETLNKLGFAVSKKKNLTLEQMKEVIEEFGERLAGGGVGLFYYSGHGMQVSGNNYLIPVEAVIRSEAEVEYKAVYAGLVLAKMTTARNGMNIVILDACRDNPFSRSFRSSSKGLTSMNAPSGTIIAYATAPAEVASDDIGYTSELAREMQTPGLKIEDVFKRVRVKIENKSKGRQVPWESSSLKGDFYFAGGSVIHDTPSVEETAKGVLMIEGNVDGAAVYINDRYEGETPLRVSLETGAYTVTLKKDGYITAKETVKIEKGREKRLSVLLDRVRREPRAGDIFKDPTTGMEFVYVKGGCYQMGDTFGDGDPDEKPVHEVCVDDFYIGKYEVTLGEFRKFINDTGYRTEAEKGDGCFGWAGSSWKKDNSYNWKNLGFSQDDCHPVACVSWSDTQEYIKWLNKKTGFNYRLPTEAEWEYAARSGGKKEKYSGSDDVDSVAWYDGNSGRETHPAGTKQPNGLGIYDMTGNVGEWVNDWYDSNYYQSSPRSNPKGPNSGSNRVLRGGGWCSYAWVARAADRSRSFPVVRNGRRGFRLSRTN